MKKNLEAWHVVYKKKGYQNPHNHSTAWLSGVIYLKVVENPCEFEGAIELSQHGYNYKVISQNYPRIIHSFLDE